MQIVETKQYGKAIVLGDGAKYNYLKVQFLNTRHIDEFRKDAVQKGEIRDKYAITLCGEGIIGNIKTRGKNKQLYNVWRNMITRCYGNKKNPAYLKVSVCQRWKTFENFYNDVSSVEGWDSEKFNASLIVLDKDIKQRFKENKVYSVNTCTWVASNINSCIQDGQQKKFVAISPVGDKYYDTNITRFSKQFGLERKQVSAVLHKRFKSTMGWEFYYDEEIV